MTRANRWKSDAQANAEALARRSTPYSEASGVSFTVNWQFHNREPRDLREAVRMVRQAYADEVPQKLHDAQLGEAGTPRMSGQALGYMFGSENAGEEHRAECDCRAISINRNLPFLEAGEHHDDCASKAPRPALDFYRTPFRAALAHLERVNKHRGAIVSHVSIGSLSPSEAAMREGVPAWCAKEVAESTLRSFLRNLSDVKLHLPREDQAA